MPPLVAVPSTLCVSGALDAALAPALVVVCVPLTVTSPLGLDAPAALGSSVPAAPVDPDAGCDVVTLELATVPEPPAPIVSVTCGFGAGGALAVTGAVSDAVSVENQPSPPDVSFGSVAAVVDGSLDGVVGVEGVCGVDGVVLFVEGAGVVAGVLGTATGVPIESLTTGAFANGSFDVVDALFGADATSVCLSVTTGTRRVTVGAAA